ncbi:hypothetical protein [Metabacillus fastidiosus]|uniref:hypothetical protein n=1 Tax=Metabacillus fastidiosus TaxID=1458 RepID=UPI003D2D6984
MIYSLCKTVIANKKYEYEPMLNKLDVYLLGNRITTEEYTELKGVMDTQQTTV